MKLTRVDLQQIRELRWIIKDAVGDGKPYYTLADETSTRLFWIDFLRYIFAPRFKSQMGITRINTFEITTPVILGLDLHLLLPTMMESVVHFAENSTDRTFTFHRVKALPSLIIGISFLTFIIFMASSGIIYNLFFTERSMLVRRTSRFFNERVV